METMIFHTVNAGLYFWSGKTGLLIDGLHNGRAQGFSPLPPSIGRDLQTHSGLFAHLDGLLFTHLHGDHFSRSLMLQALSADPPPLVYGPGLQENSVYLRPIYPGLWSFHLGQARLLSLATVHDGAAFRKDPHRSFFLRLNGECIFIAGDALLMPDQARLLRDYYGGPVAAAFINPYQAADPESLSFLHVLDPRRIFLYHLPFQEDDQFCCLVMAKQVLRRFPEHLPRPERLPHMKWLDGKSAPWSTPQKGESDHDLPGIPQHRPLF